MNKNDSRSLEKRKRILDAWRSLVPGATLNGRTLEQFEQATAGAVDVRQQIAENHRVQAGLRQDRKKEDAKLRAEIADLVDAIKGDPLFGANSALYAACGYVPRDARRSGLTRKSKPQDANAA